jgi:hypothetical protein
MTIIYRGSMSWFLIECLKRFPNAPHKRHSAQCLVCWRGTWHFPAVIRISPQSNGCPQSQLCCCIYLRGLPRSSKWPLYTDHSSPRLLTRHGDPHSAALQGPVRTRRHQLRAHPIPILDSKAHLQIWPTASEMELPTSPRSARYFVLLAPLLLCQGQDSATTHA